MMKLLITVLSLYYVCIYAETKAKQTVVDSNAQHSFDSSSNHRLSVLLVSVPSTGHLNPVLQLALGEELVRRGHNVTLCVPNNPDFTGKIKSKVTRIEVNFITTGQSIFKTVQGENAGKGAISSGALKFPSVLGNEAETILNFMDTFIEQNDVDVIIGEEFLTVALVCASHRYQILTIFMSSTLQLLPYMYPSWPWPGMLSGAVFDDLTFLQRLFVLFERTIAGFLMNYVMVPPQLSKVGKFCHDLTRCYASIAPGTYHSQLISSAIGLEYPRTILPLSHYVGPVLTKSPDPLPTDLQAWLSKKHDCSIIYISMGSHMSVSREMGEAIISSISKTSYSVVWALRSSTLFETLGFQLDRNKFFVTSWAPQLSVLGHRAI